MLGIGRQIMDRIGDGTQQHVIDHRWKGLGEAPQFLWCRGHDVEVRTGQELLLPLPYPGFAFRPLAVRTGPVPTGIGHQAFIPAMVALLTVESARFGATGGDVLQGGALAG